MKAIVETASKCGRLKEKIGTVTKKISDVQSVLIEPSLSKL